MILLTAICLILGGLYMKEDTQGWEQGGAGLNRGAHNESMQASGGNNTARVRVDFYYEVLCPDSRSFLLYQLAPAWEELRDIFSINYIPYGKAQTYGEDDRLRFSCQHGPVECQGNIWHACAAKYIGSPDTRLDYIKCMINDNYNPYRAALRCSREVTVDWPAISVCAQGKEGLLLHSLAGQRTHALRPKVTFIPTIELDGAQLYQRDVRRHLKRNLCTLHKGPSAPSACTRII